MSVAKCIRVFNCAECPYSVKLSTREYLCEKTDKRIDEDEAQTDFEYPESCPLDY